MKDPRAALGLAPKKLPRLLARDGFDDPDDPYLTFRDTADTPLPVGDFTLEELTDMLDQDAESNNSHSFCGAHRALAAVLYAEVGRNVATNLMLAIAGFSGLHGMVNDAGSADGYPTALKHYGIPSPWKEWKLR